MVRLTISIDRPSSLRNGKYKLAQSTQELFRLCRPLPPVHFLVELNAEQQLVDNYASYIIAECRSSYAVEKALEALERRVEQLTTELITHKASKDRIFKAPPPKWIEERIGRFKKSSSGA